jgi:phage baseplate assembly protein W
MSNKYSSYKQFLEDSTKRNSNIPNRDSFNFAGQDAIRKVNGLVGLAPLLPLTFSKEGPYNLITELKDLVKQNFKNLILTEPGERIMDNNFGVGLKQYLFENITVALQQDISQNIRQQKAKYMPYVNIDNIEFENDQNAPNYLGISIYYSIPSLSIEDVLSVAIGE